MKANGSLEFSPSDGVMDWFLVTIAFQMNRLISDVDRNGALPYLYDGTENHT